MTAQPLLDVNDLTVDTPVSALRAVSHDPTLKHLRGTWMDIFGHTAERKMERKLVASGKLDLVWLNPSIIPSMAVRGVGPFRRKYPLRALAVFPSWDRLVIAVSPQLSVRTVEELIAKKPKMNVSIAVNECVDFAIKTLLKAHGISQQDFIEWGGTVDEVVRPSNPHRRLSTQSAPRAPSCTRATTRAF